MRVLTFLLVFAFLIPSCSLQKRKYTRGFYLHNRQNNCVKNSPSESKDFPVAEEINAPASDSLKTEMNELIIRPEKTFPAIFPDSLQTNDSLKVMIISNKVGEIIDSTEKSKFRLFPFWSKEDFKEARFVIYPDGKVFLEGKMKNGTIKKVNYSTQQLNELTMNYFNESVEFKVDANNRDIVKNPNPVTPLKESLLPLLAFVAVLLGIVLILSIGSAAEFFLGIALILFGISLSWVALRRMKSKEVSSGGKFLAVLSIIMGLGMFGLLIWFFSHFI